MASSRTGKLPKLAVLWRAIAVALALGVGTVAQALAEQHVGQASPSIDPRWALPLFGLGGLLLALGVDRGEL